METRGTRKRRWQSSPDKKTARASLDFSHVENTPPRKKRRENEIQANEEMSGNSTNESDDSFESVNIKKFYGAKEKKHFPHSPGRRKTVNKVLSRISGDENNTSASEDEWLTLKRNKELDKASSDSGTECGPVLRDKNKSVLRTRNRSVSLGSKHVENKITNKINTSQKFISKKPFSPVISALKRENDLPITPPASGRKFFRHKSPASADKVCGGVIIGKGFNLKFLPKRRLSADNLSQSKQAGKKQNIESKKSKRSRLEASNSLNMQHAQEDRKLTLRNLSFDGSRISDSTSQQVLNVNETVSQEKNLETNTNSPDSCFDNQNDIAHTTKAELSSSSDGKSNAIDTCDNMTDSACHSGLSSKETVQSSDSQTTEEIECDKQGVAMDTSDKFSCNESIGGSSELFSATSVSSSGRSTPTSDMSSETVSDSLSSVMSGPSLRRQTDKKYYPLFSQHTTPKQKSVQDVISKTIKGRKDLRGSPGLKLLDVKDDSEQMILDAGQKKWGATQCEVCGMIFTHGSPVDHTTHAKFHQSFVNTLKFPGWKKERVVAEYPEDGCRIIMVLPDDQKYAVKKVEEINKIMGQELGFPDPALSLRAGYKAFLYVSDEKKVDGCCVAESVNEGYRVIPDSQPSQSSQQHPGRRPWCCQSDPEPAAVGVSRIWVSGQQRRKGVASKLLDSVRHWFEYGVPVEKDQLAFSDPTPDGKNFATKYTGTSSFLVYKYS